MSVKNLDRLLYKGEQAQVIEGGLCFGGHFVPVRNGIPRFTPDVSYSANFALLRDKHSTLQLDSANRTSERRDTILERTRWPPDFFADKHLLECGCGAGPDTEILLSLGAYTTSVDLAGVDVARQNVRNHERAQFIQASIIDLPLREKSFDIVFCHRVLQHTPDPEQTLRHILRFVKPDGAVFVHSYANTWFQRFRWKYALLPLTNKLDPRTLYKLIKGVARPMFRFTNISSRTSFGRRFNWIFVPFLNHRHLAKFREVSDEDMLEHAIHNTFDALSPKYDKPIKTSAMRDIASGILICPFEIYENETITLLRTIVGVTVSK